MKKDAVTSSKINNRYLQQSKDLVEKFKRMFKMNLLAIAGLAVLVLGASIYLEMPAAGLLLALLFGILVISGKKELDSLEQITPGESGYQYLKAFDNWLKSVIGNYTNLYRFIYPAIFLILMLAPVYSEFGQSALNKLLAENPDITMIAGIPLLWLLAALAVATLTGIFAGKIYQLDMNMVYGAEFKKLQELLSDMEELRK